MVVVWHSLLTLVTCVDVTPPAITLTTTRIEVEFNQKLTLPAAEIADAGGSIQSSGWANVIDTGLFLSIYVSVYVRVFTSLCVSVLCLYKYACVFVGLHLSACSLCVRLMLSRNCG